MACPPKRRLPTPPDESFRFGLFFEARGRPPDGFVQAVGALKPLLPWVAFLATLALIAFAIHSFA